MAYCKHCGKPLEGDDKFCEDCGQEVTQAETVTPPGAAPVGVTADTAGPAPTAGPAAYSEAAPPPPAGPPPMAAAPPPAGTYPPGAGTAPQSRGGRKWLWIGIAAVVVVAAIACILAFVVFNGEGAAAGTPEQTVQQFFDALENKDMDAVLGLLDPTLLEGMPTDALEAAKEEMGSNLFDFQSIDFSGLKLSTDMTSDNTATVTVTEGTATVVDTSGETTVEDVKDADTPVAVELIKKDGSWYIETPPFL